MENIYAVNIIFYLFILLQISGSQMLLVLVSFIVIGYVFTSVFSVIS